MDVDSEEESTQLATQPLPTHNGIPPSHSHGPDLSDALCVLHPGSPVAIQIVHHLAANNSPLIVKLPEPQVNESKIELDPIPAEPAKEHGDVDDDFDDEEAPTQQAEGDKKAGPPMALDIVLRNHNPGPKDPYAGFIFGRNPNKCDVLLVEFSSYRRVSNLHFRIFCNKNGILMLEDLSTNGTWVDSHKLGKHEPSGQKRMLQGGSMIDLVPGGDKELIRFHVRMPKQTMAAKAQSPHGLAVGIDPGPPPTQPPPQIGAANVNVRAPRPNMAQLQRLPQRFQDDYHSDAHSIRSQPKTEGWTGGGKYNMEPLPIGKGAFATVTKAVEVTTGDPYAVKTIAKRTFATQGAGTDRIGVKKEVDILEKLDHPHIVKYVSYHEDPKFVHIIMEYIEFGDLSGYIQKHGFMEEELAKDVIRQVLQGIEYVHRMGISHRDLKPDNILISCEDPIHVKISDFGLAKMVHNEETFLKTFCGTMLYLAPEVFPGYISATQADLPTMGAGKRKRLPGDDAGRPGRKKKTTPYNQAVDMWSLGCVVYVLLTGKPPFNGANQEEMFALVLKGEYDERLLMEKVGADNTHCLDFIRSLLQVSPSHRMMEVEALRHPWLATASESSGSMESQGDYDDDRVQGVGYSLPGADESDFDIVDDDDLEEAVFKAPRPEGIEDEELRGSMASMNMTRGLGNYNIGASDDDYFASLAASNGYGNGLSVIRKEVLGRDARPQLSYKRSSEIFPTNNIPETADSAVESNHEESVQDSFSRNSFDDFDKPSQSADLHQSRNPFEFDDHFETPQEEHFVTPQEQSSASKSGGAGSLNGALGNLNFATAAPSPYTTPPPQDHPSPPAKSFSFMNEAVVNLSPPSLNPSPVVERSTVPRQLPQPRPALPPTPGPQDLDDDLPATMPVQSQPRSMSEPPVPWGRLTLLPGSVDHPPLTLLDQQITIGRSLSSTFVETDPRISKFHFALQLNHPKKDHQNIAAESRPGEWQLDPSLVAFYKVEGLNGVLINDKKKAKGETGRIYDGDEVVLFRDHSKEKSEFLGFKIALWLEASQRPQSEESDDECTPRNYMLSRVADSTAGVGSTIAVASEVSRRNS